MSLIEHAKPGVAVNNELIADFILIVSFCILCMSEIIFKYFCRALYAVFLIEASSFKDQRLLFKTLTPKRFEILQHAHEKDGISIRLLAKELGRDYSNVHQDVKILHRLGLMIKNEKNDKYYVPWDVIVTEIPLQVIKKTKTHRPISNQKPPRVAHG